MRQKKLKLPHPFRQSVKYDRVKPSDFAAQNLVFACEQCSHFDGTNLTCSLGYETTPHLRKTNLATYNSSGRMAFCRYLEID